MIVFLIVVAVIILLFAILFSLSATITIVHEKGWSTKVKVLWIEKDIVLSELLSFVLFPEKKAKDVADADKEKKDNKKKEKETKTVKTEDSPSDKTEGKAETAVEKKTPEIEEKTEKLEKTPTDENIKASSKKTEKPQKSNPIKKIWDEEGVLGILSLATNIIETANSAILTLFRGLHIYSLYVMIIVGGSDADVIAQRYGVICKYYYPIKGFILNGMKVDNYDDYVQPDFIAPATEFEMQFIASISVGLLVKMLLKAGIVFLKNLIVNKKENK